MNFPKKFLLLIQLIFILFQYTNSLDYERKTELKCGEGGMLVSGICYKCKANCLECSSPGTCGKCDNKKYVMRDNECIVSQSYLQYQEFLDYQKDPLIQEAQGCLEGCRSQGDFICTSCMDGYKYNSGFCEACQAVNCKDCKADKGICIKCFDGFALENSKSCVACNDTNCHICTDSSSKGCNECKIGYKSNGSGGCEACIAGCAKCSSTTKCIICLDGFYLDNNQICQLCGANVELCSSASSIISCKPNFALLNGQCVDVSNVYGITDSSSCQVFETSISCKNCFFGHQLFNKKCYRSECLSNQYKNSNSLCENCSQNVQKCVAANNPTECDQGFYIQGGACIDCKQNQGFKNNKEKINQCDQSSILKCIEGYGVSADKKSCSKCPDSCADCTFDVSEKVLKCLQCKVGYIPDKQNQTNCLECNKFNHCKACKSNLVDCIECLPGYYLTEFGNCSNQITNCYQVYEEGCKVCRVGYRRSEDKKSCINCKTSGSCQKECKPDSLLSQKTSSGKNYSSKPFIFSYIYLLALIQLYYFI